MKKILYIVKIVVLTFIFWATVSSGVEQMHIKKEIKEFLKEGVYQEELSTKKVKYYAVYDPKETLPAFTTEGGVSFPGTLGDIMVGLRSPFPDTLFDPFITYYIGGHAALCAGVYIDQVNIIKESDCLEATGLEPGESVASSSSRYYWNDNEYRNEVIGLRTKCSQQDRQRAFNYAIGYLQDPYNYSFVFNRNNTKYCTDIVSEAYKKVGVNLNKDKVGVTVLDLVVSDDTYMFYYKYFDADGITHIYYRTNKI